MNTSSSLNSSLGCKAILYALVALSIFLTFDIQVCAEAESASGVHEGGFSVENEDGKISIFAKEADLQELLKEIALKTDVQIEALDSIDQKISIQIERKSLSEIMAKIAENCLLVFENKSKGPKVSQIYVLSRGEKTKELKNPKPQLAEKHKEISYELAEKVATYYATKRWEGIQVGPGQLYCAPDGTPEVYYFVVLKKDLPIKTLESISEEVATLRKRRIEIEQDLEDSSEKSSSLVGDLWREMSAGEKYGTVIVGAHEGREPFIASYSGLPPHIFLKEDAVETRRAQIGGANPGEPKFCWLPPTATVFQFPAADKTQQSVFLEVRGTQFRQIPLANWKRTELAEGALQQRKNKWQLFRETAK
ncbi:MAG: hypothetical protein ABID54_08575 [Pseudomonadota bacterium]